MDISFSPNTYELLTGIPFPTSGNIVIPNTITDKDGNIHTVTEIEDYAFSSDNYSDITEVFISDGITRIGVKAFYRKANLIKVTLPNSVQIIDDLAFFFCESLEEINMPNSIIKIGDGAFNNCISLEYIDIPYGTPSIGMLTFAGSGLKEVIIPDSVYIIQECAFSGCINLSKIIFSNNLLYISSSAFMHCKSLEEVVIPASVNSVGEKVFVECTNLRSLIFEDNSRLKAIGELAFYNCEKLERIIINTIFIINSKAFMNCINLKLIKYCDKELTTYKDIREKFGRLLRNGIFINTPFTNN